MTIVIRPYTSDDRSAWNAFVKASKNGTFLFDRDYMDYHSDRFSDHSYIIEIDGSIGGLFPANARGTDLHSHQGLTFGGFVVDARMTTPVMLELFEAAQQRWRDDGFGRVYYKTVPSIYTSIPAEEDRYALFLGGCRLYRRDVLSVIWPGKQIELQTRRMRGVKKAQKAGITISEAEDFSAYWTVLANNLKSRYGTTPVHTLAEIELLRSRFPERIRLFQACTDNIVMGGAVLYETQTVSHVQYIASTDHGRSNGALDILFYQLIERAQSKQLIFDMGISNEDNGKILNHGLIEQKEGFGGRALAHDFYEILL